MKVKKYERQLASVNIKQTKNELINLCKNLTFKQFILFLF